MTNKIDLHPISRQRQILIVLFVSISLALASACTPARQIADQRNSNDNSAETLVSNEADPRPETVEETEKPMRKQRLLPAPFRTAEIEEESPEVEEELSTDLLTDNTLEEKIEETPQSTEVKENNHAHARLASNSSDDKLEEVLTQLVEQHETIIHLMQEQMEAQKELASARPTPAEPSPTASARQSFGSDELYEEPSYAQKTVLEKSVAPHEVVVSIAPDRTVILDEELLIQWENTVADMERGAIPRTKLPAWILQGLEWITHAPSHEPERSQILMPLYRHMQYAGHLDQVNMNSMSPKDVVRIIRVFLNEMKEQKGRIRKA